MTMRYLFSIQGEGRGHLTQALSLAAMLRRHGHQVVGVLVGRSSVRRLPDFFFERIGAPVTEFEAPRFAFDHANRSVSMLRTLLLNAAPARLAAYDRSMRLIRDRIAERTLSKPALTNRRPTTSSTFTNCSRASPSGVSPSGCR